jgi:hypothetical protein
MRSMAVVTGRLGKIDVSTAEKLQVTRKPSREIGFCARCESAGALGSPSMKMMVGYCAAEIQGPRAQTCRSFGGGSGGVLSW